MGIDIYLEWDGQTEEERMNQITCGFSTQSGSVGYLREAYHGEPYATVFLLREAFESDDATATIPNYVLTDRLEETKKIVIKRAKDVYEETLDEDSPDVKAFEDFVELHCLKEQEGLNPVIVASY